MGVEMDSMIVMMIYDHDGEDDGADGNGYDGDNGEDGDNNGADGNGYDGA